MNSNRQTHDRNDGKELDLMSSRLVWLIVAGPSQRALKEKGIRLKIYYDYHTIRDGLSDHCRWSLCLTAWQTFGFCGLQINRQVLNVTLTALDCGRRFELWYPDEMRSVTLDYDQVVDWWVDFSGTAKQRAELDYVANSRRYADDNDEQFKLITNAVKSTKLGFWNRYWRSRHRLIETALAPLAEPDGQYRCSFQITDFVPYLFGRICRIKRVQKFEVRATKDLLFTVDGTGFEETQFMTPEQFYQWWEYDLMEFMGKEGSAACRAISNFGFLCGKKGINLRNTAWFRSALES